MYIRMYENRYVKLPPLKIWRLASLRHETGVERDFGRSLNVLSSMCGICVARIRSKEHGVYVPGLKLWVCISMSQARHLKCKTLETQHSLQTVEGA